MSFREAYRATRKTSYVVAVVAAFLCALIYLHARVGFHALYDSVRYGYGPQRYAWKEPLAPAEFVQSSCGACHRDDLPEAPRLAHGRELIARYNCTGCHTLQDIQRPVMLGPDLSSVGTKLTREWIYKWLKEPRTITDSDGNVVIDGVATSPRMPKFTLSDREIRALSAFLSVQQEKPVKRYTLNQHAIAAVLKNGDPADQGEIRFNQMFCVTCHALSVNRGGESTLIGGDIGPELTKVGSKVKPEWLIAWLEDPEGYLAHTRMPRYQWSDKDIYLVTQYIMKRLTDPDLLQDVPKMATPTSDEINFGKALFVSKGCVQCHVIHGLNGREHFGPDLSRLGMSPLPSEVISNIQHTTGLPVHFKHHSGDQIDVMVSRVPRFMIQTIMSKITNPASVTPDTHMPAFPVSNSDAEDITTALLSMVGPPPSAEKGISVIVPARHATFQPTGDFLPLYERYKCFDCHSFRGYGGTLAPDLSYEGSRAQRAWLIAFLMKPQTLRPTLTVRMPEFSMSQQEASTLADYILNNLTSTDVSRAAKVSPAATVDQITKGQKLFMEKYKCQSCHTIGSSGGYVGPSLNNAGNWLTPEWIEAWLRNPQALIPATIEPRHNFTDTEIDEITAYISSLKQTSEATAMNAGGAK